MVETELVVAEPTHIPPREPILALAPGEQAVLFQQRTSLLQRVAKRHKDDRIREQIANAVEAKNVIVVFGEIPIPAFL